MQTQLHTTYRAPSIYLTA